MLLLSLMNAVVAAPESAVSPAMAATAQRLMELAQQDNGGYALVRSLTTEVGPRLAGTEAEARARQWAVEKLEALGFQNVRVESFEVPLWLRGEERADIIAPFPQALKVRLGRGCGESWLLRRKLRPNRTTGESATGP